MRVLGFRGCEPTTTAIVRERERERERERGARAFAIVIIFGAVELCRDGMRVGSG